MDNLDLGINFSFGPYRLHKKSLMLFCNEQSIKIEPQVAQLLLMFLENHGKVLTRDQIAAYLSPNRILSDDALRSSIRKLREILNDKAKSPQYIKTLPMKGYEFIAPVETFANTTKSANTKTTSKTTPTTAKPWRLLLTCTILIISLIAVWWINTVNVLKQPPSITKLTSIAGSELLPSYDPIHKRLIFSHRANKNDFLQFYVKDMNSSELTRLTYDQANYGNAIWSPDGNRFAYIRSTPTQMHHYISEFDPQRGMINTTRLENNILSTHYLLGWSRNQHALYLTDKTSPAAPQGIWLYNIVDNTVEQISSPSVPGQGDYFAKESYDGSLLAILRSISLNKHELLVLHLATGQIVHSAQLPMKMHRLVWQQDGKSITVGSFDGDLVKVTLPQNPSTQNALAQNASTQNASTQNASTQGTLETISPDADYVNNVFFQCGEKCYYMRQHNGNYLDIAEQPNPFVNKTTGAFATYELQGANDFPMYGNTNNKLYFVSQYGQKTVIEYAQNNAKPTPLFDFAKVVEIQSIAINSADTHFVGLLDSTLFIHNIADKNLRYLSKQTDIIYPPHWIDATRFVYAKLEKNQAMLYQYSLLDNSTTFLMSGYVALLPLSNNARLLIDQEYRLWHQQNEQLSALGKLPSSQANRLKVIGNKLFYTGREENVQFLYRVNTQSGQTDKFEIAKNRFKGNFDISANQEKLAVVASLLAQSDLIKLQLH